VTTQCLNQIIRLIVGVGLCLGILLTGQTALANEMLPTDQSGKVLFAETLPQRIIDYPPPTIPAPISPAPIPLPPSPPLPVPRSSPRPSRTRTPISPLTPSAFLRQAGARYGHLPYAQASAQSLVVVGQYGRRSERLAVEAADAFRRMVQTARQQGVRIIPISGFRNLSTQWELFQNQTARRGSVAAAARASAPPGYSEHHTGYAIDLGDLNTPSTDIKTSFESTSAFHWLRKHAQIYGFELSFPLNNPQNIIYEPWHWRFVGSARARVIFDRAKQLQRLSLARSQR